jgi:hypothetical protein
MSYCTNKTYKKYSNKKYNSIKEGIGFNLTFEQYEALMLEAKITYEQIGIKGYHLARLHDMGAYEVGNCRFLHYTLNLKERKETEAMKIARSNNARLGLAAIQKLSPERKYEIAMMGVAARTKDYGESNKASSTD